MHSSKRKTANKLPKSKQSIRIRRINNLFLALQKSDGPSKIINFLMRIHILFAFLLAFATAEQAEAAKAADVSKDIVKVVPLAQVLAAKVDDVKPAQVVAQVKDEGKVEEVKVPAKEDVKVVEAVPLIAQAPIKDVEKPEKAAEQIAEVIKKQDDKVDAPAISKVEVQAAEPAQAPAKVQLPAEVKIPAEVQVPVEVQAPAQAPAQVAAPVEPVPVAAPANLVSPAPINPQV